MKKILSTLVIVLIILVAIGIGMKYTAPKGGEEQVACTMEAKMCPDGTAVGRGGPKCEFAPCPALVYEKTLKINERGLINGVYLTPLKVIEDSRCATDVQCVWAGRLTLNTKLESVDVNGIISETKELIFTAGDFKTTFADKEITFKSAMPDPISDHSIKEVEYNFDFIVATLGQ